MRGWHGLSSRCYADQITALMELWLAAAWPAEACEQLSMLWEANGCLLCCSPGR